MGDEIKKEENEKETKPEKNYLALGISLGMLLGISLGSLYDNMGIGLAIGSSFGISIGSILNAKNKKDSGEDTE